MRLFEVLLHGGPQIGGWTTRQIHRAVLISLDPSEKVAQAQRAWPELNCSRYAYRLTQKGVQVALLFLFFHKRLRGPTQ